MCDPHLPPDAMDERPERRESRLAVLPIPNGVRYLMLITQPQVMPGYLIHVVVSGGYHVGDREHCDLGLLVREF